MYVVEWIIWNVACLFLWFRRGESEGVVVDVVQTRSHVFHNPPGNVLHVLPGED